MPRTSRFNNLELNPPDQNPLTNPYYTRATDEQRALLRAFGYDPDRNLAISSGQAADIIRDTNADEILAELQTEITRPTQVETC